MLRLPDVVLAQLLAQLPRDALLRTRLASQLFCLRITSLLSDARLSRRAGFERRCQVPVALNSFSDEAQFLSRLCRRFGVDNQTWALRIRISGFEPFLAYGELCVSLASEFGERFAFELFVSGPVDSTPANRQLIANVRAVARLRGVHDVWA